MKTDTYRHSVATSSEFGDSNVSININRATWIQHLYCSLFTIHIQHHLVSVHSKMEFVPVLVKHLPAVRHERYLSSEQHDTQNCVIHWSRLFVGEGYCFSVTHTRN